MSITSSLSRTELCILELHKIGALKFGDFTLKSGIKSPVYFDLRVIISYPKIMEMVANLIWESVAGETFDHICGVLYTALPVATVISIKQGIPMLLRRKEAKAHGTKKLIEGVYTEGQTCLVIEDVIVSGSSVIETVDMLRNEKLHVKKVVVFLDREQGGEKNLKEANISVTSVITIHEMLNILQKHEKVDEVTLKNVLNFLESCRQVPIWLPKTAAPAEDNLQKFGLKERASTSGNLLSRRLFNLIASKQSNLCVAVDAQTSEELLSFAEKLGPFICLLKTHVDLIQDFSMDTVESLKSLAAKHDFLIFEDRKFADIGNVVQFQYSGGIHRILDWAHLVTVHCLPGPGVIQGLMAHRFIEDRGCILVAEMSSDKNLISDDYVKGCVEIAECYRQFVVGFVCQSPLKCDKDFVLFTPGVSLNASTDSMGQRYVSPEEAVLEKGADVIIVGRGITKDKDPIARVKEYRQRSYAALLERDQNN